MTRCRATRSPAWGCDAPGARWVRVGWAFLVAGPRWALWVTKQPEQTSARKKLSRIQRAPNRPCRAGRVSHSPVWASSLIRVGILDVMTAPPQNQLSSWLLFQDWCAGAGLSALPATSVTVQRFLIEMPVKRSTRLARISAIRRTHLAAGLPDPLPTLPVDLAPDSLLDDLLAAVTTQSWPAGASGRRDGFLLVLYAGLRLTRGQLRDLSTADIAIGSGWASVAGRRLTRDEMPGTCRVCALTRWLRILNIVEQGLSREAGWIAVKRDLAGRWAQCADAANEHDCGRALGAAWRRSPVLLPAMDRHGWVDGRAPLSVRSISTISLRRRDAADHERLPVYVAEQTAVEPPRLAPLARDHAARTLASTREQLAGLDPLLDRLDQEIEAALARSRTLLG